MLTKMDGCCIKDIISENGYYDQAHMIKEFKKFGYSSPNKLLKK
jgi:AraC-like DNA-binding protein